MTNNSIDKTVKTIFWSICAIPFLRIISAIFATILELWFPQLVGLRALLDEIIVCTDNLMNLPQKILFGR